MIRARRSKALGSVLAASLGTLLGTVACSDDPVDVILRNLDGPSDIAFGCVGDLRLTGGGEAEPGDEVTRSAQPVASCASRIGGEIPPGQEDLVPPDLYGFVLQTARGTIAVIDIQAGVVADADPFAPGRNAIPIGTLPVGLVGDRSGCYVVTANAGSCDLSALDIATAASNLVPAEIDRISIRNASGEPLLAKPRSISPGQLASEVIGVECADTPTGLFYVSFPECNLVAGVDVATGTVLGGVRMLEDGSTEITDGNVSCPAQCGSGTIASGGLVPTGGGLPDAGVPDAGVDAGAPDAGPPLDLPAGTPVAVQLSPDGQRLYLGSQNSPVLSIVDLGEDGLPVSVQRVVLEGDIGIVNVDVTDTVSVGGAFDSIGQVGVDFVFAYVIATDGSIRVVDVGGLKECDTQVDPRYLRDVTNIEFLACMPVGDAATPPRRAGARGPGIRIPTGVVPLDLEFATVEADGAEQASPILLSGTYAFVTGSDGNTFVVNVDDDNYPDFEIPADPAAVWMTLALPHQLRDFVSDRNYIETQTCSSPSEEVFELPPRLLGEVGTGFGFASTPPVNQSKRSLLPDLRGVECTASSSGVAFSAPVSELSVTAPVPVREQTFPDLLPIRNEDWFITWEGSLSLDTASVAIDGQPVRSGVFDNNQGLVTVTEAGAPYCGVGVEPFDVVQLFGCDPSRGNEQCAVGETCFIHPQTPSNITTGLCLPSDRVDDLAGRCRDVLITRRRYSVGEVFSEQLTLLERARILSTTPIAGCDSDEQCQVLAIEEDRLRAEAHPIELDAIEPGEEAFTWSCQADPSRSPGPNRCVMTCESSADCEDGLVCSSGVCVHGKLPPDECLQSVQRYQIRAGEAFAVIGTTTGFLHDRIVDPDTGMCVADPSAPPTLLGRIPLNPPPCEGDGFTDLAPNPCSTTVTHFEDVTLFEERNGVCVAQPEVQRMREVRAVRFSNPIFTVHLVDLETQGDALCNGDQAGDLPPYSPVFQDFSIGFTITGGFIPQFVTANTYLAEFPVRIRRGPTGLLWVMDQGDDRDPQRSTRGRVLTISPEAGADGFRAADAFL